MHWTDKSETVTESLIIAQASGRDIGEIAWGGEKFRFQEQIIKRADVYLAIAGARAKHPVQLIWQFESGDTGWKLMTYINMNIASTWKAESREKGKWAPKNN